MENEAFERFTRETRSLAALVIMNIVGAGLTIAFGVSQVVTNLSPLFGGQPVYLEQLLRAGVSLFACAIAMRWLIWGAQTFSGVDDLIDGSRKADAEDLTGLIVENMAWYREKRESIGRLKWGCRLVGAYFALTTALQLYNLVTTLGTMTQAVLIMSAVGLVLCSALGLIGLLVPTYIDRFIGTWDERVKASGEAEDKLGKLIEGP
jgi:hypothetical protein